MAESKNKTLKIQSEENRNGFEEEAGGGGGGGGNTNLTNSKQTKIIEKH